PINKQHLRYIYIIFFPLTESPKPVVIIKPDTHVFRGETVILRCEIVIGGDTEWTYSWYKNNTENPDHTTQEFNISSVTEYYDTDKYTCSGKRNDSQNSQFSDPVSLAVSEKPKPELRSDLKGDVLTGNSVTLYCTLKLQSAAWRFNWITQTNSTEIETEAHFYTIRSVSVSDGGQYRCRAGRGNPVYYTHYSDALWVNVTESPKPVVNIKPDTQVYRGERVTFRCDIQTGGDTEWTYSWYKDSSIFYSSHITQEFTLECYSSGIYTCSGRRNDSQLSQISDPFTLSVLAKPNLSVRLNPQIPNYTGDRVTLSCNLQGTGWEIIWYTEYQQSKYLTSGDTQNNTLNVTLSNEGQTTFYCKAHRGNYVSEFSDPATITLKARPKSVVKVQPAECVFIGESITLTCEIQAGGSWQYHWYRDNKELSDAAGEKTYTITDVKESNKV
ncbi:carcinoembryonic antigen-related cell adhesion molecule 5-like, partial [Clarias gariepinus]|uniref:carcinoembryonic antigen-related cell adhesion molecule 5-like n=1 Tax=Clarias gariepinus TaxID=13013 RepID=UPI00234DC909